MEQNLALCNAFYNHNMANCFTKFNTRIKQQNQTNQLCWQACHLCDQWQYVHMEGTTNAIRTISKPQNSQRVLQCKIKVLQDDGLSFCRQEFTELRSNYHDVRNADIT